MPRDEEVVYNFVRELLKTKQVSDPTFAAAKSLLGERGIVDLIGLVGFYQSTSLMMNVDRYPMQGDQKPELKKLENPLPTGARLEQAPTTRGRRFPPLSTNQITPEQRHMADLVTSGKIQDGTGGSFNVLLRSPALGEAVVRYGEYVRFRSPLPAQLNQLAALITARYWTAQFPWYAHHRAAVQAGLSETAISAIAGGRRPTSLQPDEEAVYNFCTELLKTSEVSDATYRAVKDQLGEAGVVELLGIVGYYGTVSMLVNTDRYPLPDGATPELRPLPESR
jgi:4-carboxymuconolactone decarboxylase